MAQTVERDDMDRARASSDRPFGPVAAVFIAAGIGALVLGVLTTLAEASESVASALQWSDSVGPLSGKTILAAAAFFGSWAVLYAMLRRKDPNPRRVFMWVGIMVVVALLMTFPIFFQAFAPEG
jgi:hypothetical protein